MVGAPVRRRQAYLCHGGLSIRRACALMSVARSTLRYESRLVKRDAPVVAVMRELAAQYPRYGYRRIQVFLSRRGHVMSADRTHRLWRLHGLQVPRKRPCPDLVRSRGRQRPRAMCGYASVSRQPTLCAVILLPTNASMSVCRFGTPQSMT
jgi:putative transposase